MSFKINCPHCKRALNVTEPAFGKTVPCPGCKQPIKVPHPAAAPATAPAQRATPWSGGADNLAAESTPAQLPPSMPPTPDGYPLANDPLEFLHSESAAASVPPRSSGGNPPLPAGMPPMPPTNGSPAIGGGLDFLSAASPPSPSPAMPPLPQDGQIPAADATDALLATYRSQMKPRGEEIGRRIAQGADALKKRARALKLRHDVSSLWTAVNSQLENLGTLAITHRPPSVDMSSEIAELSQVQRELAQHQVTMDSLRQGAGGRSVVKQIEGEVARLRDRQREAVIAIGRKVAAARPDMPSAAGTYSALDRVQSSLTAAEAALAEIEREIGPTGLYWEFEFR